MHYVVVKEVKFDICCPKLQDDVWRIARSFQEHAVISMWIKHKKLMASWKNTNGMKQI